MPKEPIRCLEGNAKPHEPFWTFRNAVIQNAAADDEQTETELEFYGYISEYSWFDDDITPKLFRDQLNQYGKGGPITIRMNSGGGDLIAGSVIRSILVEYPGKVTVRIDGLAASAATLVALAGDVIRMQDSAYFMIHDPAVSFFFATLNVEYVERLNAELKAVKAGLVDTYAKRTGLSTEKISKMMTQESWLSANEALNYGFVDEVITDGKKAKDAAVTPNIVNKAILNAITPELAKRYVNIPVNLLQPAEEPVLSNAAMDALRAEVKILI
jgi:ATP-dependent Clp protease protease subunit